MNNNMPSNYQKSNFIKYMNINNFRNMNKQLIINFLTEIYRNYYKRCDKLFDNYSFQELLKIPLIVSDKIYYTLIPPKDKIMNLDIFTNGIFDIFYGDLDDKMSLIFDILDFNKDRYILKDDVFLILSHLHFIENSSDTIPILEKLINNFFEKNTKLDKDICFNIKKNFDILLLFQLFITKYVNIISENELTHYEVSMSNKPKLCSQLQKLKTNSFMKFNNKNNSFLNSNSFGHVNSINTKSQNTNNGNSIASVKHLNDSFNNLNLYDEMEYKPSTNLLNYLDSIDFYKNKKKNQYENEEYSSDDSSDSSEDEDLNDLIDFSYDFKELKDRFINNINIEPKLITSTFSNSFFQPKLDKPKKNEILDEVNKILENEPYKKIRVREKRRASRLSNIATLLDNGNIINNNNPEQTIGGLSNDGNNSIANNNLSTNIASNDIISTNINGLRRAQTNFMAGNFISSAVIKRTITKFYTKYELPLYKLKQDGSKKYIKLTLVGHYIYYYEKYNQGYDKDKYLFKKIIPTSSLFIKKNKERNSKDKESKESSSKTIKRELIIQLISNVRNVYIKKRFFCQVNNIDFATKFIKKFNKINGYSDIKKDYYFKFEIGSGKFGHVFLALKNSDKTKKFAIKLIQKNGQTIEEYKINRWELCIFKMLENLNHPNIIKCYEFYESDSQIFFVYEYVSSGDLKNYMRDLKLEVKDYNINTILKLTIHMIDGVRVLHKFGIIHRDLKMTNMMVKINSPIRNTSLLSSNGVSDFHLSYVSMAECTLKIIDFGLSRILGKYEVTNDPYGSLCFEAPEQIAKKYYDFKVDVWAAGVTLYYLIYRELPFGKGSREEIKNAIMHSPVIYTTNEILTNNIYFNDLNKINSKSTRDIKSSILYSILKDCLEKNPSKRISSDELYKKYVPVIKSLN